MQIDALLIDLDDGDVSQETIDKWEARVVNMTDKMGIDLGADLGSNEVEPT